jgi:hypothetical protein
MESTPTPIGIAGVYEGTLLLQTGATGLLTASASTAVAPFINHTGLVYFASATTAAWSASLRTATPADRIDSIQAYPTATTLFNTAALTGVDVRTAIVVIGVTSGGEQVRLSGAPPVCISFDPKVVQTDAGCNIVLSSTAVSGAEQASISVAYTAAHNVRLQRLVSVKVLFPASVRVTAASVFLRPIGLSTCTSFVFERTPLKAVASYQTEDGSSDETIHVDVTSMVLPLLSSSNADIAETSNGWILGRSEGDVIVGYLGNTALGSGMYGGMKSGSGSSGWKPNDGLATKSTVSSVITWRNFEVSVVTSPVLNVLSLEAKLESDTDIRVSSSGISVAPGITRHIFTVSEVSTSLTSSKRSAPLYVEAVLSDGGRVPLSPGMGVTVASKDELALVCIAKESHHDVALPSITLPNSAAGMTVTWIPPGCELASTPLEMKLIMDVGMDKNLQLQLRALQARIRSGPLLGESQALPPTVAILAVTAFSVNLQQESTDLSLHSLMIFSIDVVEGPVDLVTLFNNTVVASSDSNAKGTVVISAWLDGYPDAGVATTTIIVLTASDPNWESLVMTNPATSATIQSKGPIANRALFKEWVAGHGGATSEFITFRTDDIPDASQIQWTFHNGSNIALRPEMPACGSATQIVTFTATFWNIYGASYSADTQAVFTIIDSEPPSFLLPPTTTTIQRPQDSADAAFDQWSAIHGGATVIDRNVASVFSWTYKSKVQAPSDGLPGCSAVHQTTFTVTDNCGNSATADADLTVIVSPLQLVRPAAPVEIALGSTSTANPILDKMQKWLEDNSQTLVVASSGAVAWGPSLLSPQFDAIFQVLTDNLKSYRTETVAVCHSTSFVRLYTAIDSCTGTAELSLDWMLVDRIPLSSGSGTDEFVVPAFEYPPQNITAEPNTASSLALYKEWLNLRAFAIVAGGSADSLVWGAPNLEWRVKNGSPSQPKCGDSQICTATFIAKDRCGVEFRFSAEFNLQSECSEAKMTKEATQFIGFPLWDEVIIDDSTDPFSSALVEKAVLFDPQSTPAFTATDATPINRDTWIIIVIVVMIVLIGIALVAWTKSRVSTEMPFDKEFDSDRRQPMSVHEQAQAEALALQMMYPGRFGQTAPMAGYKDSPMDGYHDNLAFPQEAASGFVGNPGILVTDTHRTRSTQRRSPLMEQRKVSFNPTGMHAQASYSSHRNGRSSKAVTLPVTPVLIENPTAEEEETSEMMATMLGDMMQADSRIKHIRKSMKIFPSKTSSSQKQPVASMHGKTPIGMLHPLDMEHNSRVASPIMEWDDVGSPVADQTQRFGSSHAFGMNATRSDANEDRSVYPMAVPSYNLVGGGEAVLTDSEAFEGSKAPGEGSSDDDDDDDNDEFEHGSNAWAYDNVGGTAASGYHGTTDAGSTMDAGSNIDAESTTYSSSLNL